MEIVKMCTNCKHQKTTQTELHCAPCDFYYSNWEPKDVTINPNELITELNTKLFDEQALKNMSNRDRVSGVRINKVVGELIDWVKNKL